MASLLAYVPNFNDDTVSVVDVTNNIVITTIQLPAGSQPYGAAVLVKAGASKVYITNSGTGNVSVIDTFTNTVIKTITVGSNPRPIAVNAQGSLSSNRIYVGNFGDNSITVIDTTTDTVNTTWTHPTISQPSGLIADSNFTLLWITNFNTNSVTLLDTNLGVPDTFSVIANVPVGLNPIGIDKALFPQNGFTSDVVYVANSGSGTVTVMELDTIIGTVPVGNSPFGVAVAVDGTSQTGQYVYVTNTVDKTVTKIEPRADGTFLVVSTIPVTGTPFGIDSELSIRTHPALSDIDALGRINGTMETNVVPVGDNPISLGHFIGLVQAIAPLPLIVTKSFFPTTISVGQTSTITITIQNPNNNAVNNIQLLDPYPLGIITANPNNLSLSGGSGTVVAAPGGNSLQLTNGSLAAFGMLTISVDIIGTEAGVWNNTTGGATSNETPPAPGASAVITVIDVPPPPPKKKRRRGFGAFALPPTLCIAKNRLSSQPTSVKYFGVTYFFSHEDETTYCFRRNNNNRI